MCGILFVLLYFVLCVVCVLLLFRLCVVCCVLCVVCWMLYALGRLMFLKGKIRWKRESEEKKEIGSGRRSEKNEK